MVQVLEGVPSFGSSLGQSLGAGLNKGMSEGRKFSQMLQLEESKKKSMLDAMANEKFQTGLDIIGGMREIASKKNIGKFSSVLGAFPGETQKDRAEFEQLGKSLIPLVAAGVPIRNQKEFEEYKKVITDPSSPLSTIEGALNGLERIFNQKLTGKDQEKSSKSKKATFNSSNPEHQAKAKQLFKKFGDKEKVREKLKLEFEGL